MLRATQFAQDTQAESRSLHTTRDKVGHEIDFVFTSDEQLTHLIEVKTSHATSSAYLRRVAEQFAQTQIVHQLRLESDQGRVAVRRAVSWLSELAA